MPEQILTEGKHACIPGPASGDGFSLVTQAGYKSFLTFRQTNEAIDFIKARFQSLLTTALNVRRVSAPPVVHAETGINDYLNGVEKPLSFLVKRTGDPVEVVQSLAKWKRLALAAYGFGPGEGLYTDMNAIRPDEKLDNLHSIYVDQWDWERTITPAERNAAYLEETVRRIYRAVRSLEDSVCRTFPALPNPYLPPEIEIVHAQELEDRFPDLTPDEREDEICREHGAVFIRGIGGKLFGGSAHGGRAPDYDDWSSIAEDGLPGLNGDIFVWYPPLNRSMELSSMGIRVDPPALERQLVERGATRFREMEFHRMLLEGRLPQSIGGGIGQSRLSMMYLRKAHIGEVQAGVWPLEMQRACNAAGIKLL